MLASSGYVCRGAAGLCKGCGTCTRFCQFQAIELDHGRVRIDETACMGCGVCVSKCENGVLTLERVPEKGEPLEIAELIASAPTV
jgi:heterodisulfide reductase subunit A-like polyferredoxin